MASYIGVVNVDSKRPAVREIRAGGQYFEVVEGISEDNIYLLRRGLLRSDEDGVSLVKKPKNSDSYVTVKRDLITGISFLTNDERGFVGSYGPWGYWGGESAKNYVYVPLNTGFGITPQHEYLISLPKDSAFRLTAVQSPDGNYAVIEERYISLWETPPRTSQRFLALDLKTRELSLLYERSHVWDACDKRLGVIKWICEPGTYDSVYSLNIVNN